MSRYSSHLAYLAVGLFSLVLAVFISSRVVRSTHAQVQESSATAATEQVAPPAPAAPPAPTTTPVPNSLLPAPNNIAAQTAINENVAFLEPYVFDLREGRRNPFRPPQLADGSLPDIVLPGTPLERYELDELKLAGIMWDVKSPKAMIIDPQGEVHVLGKDDRIGRKRGYVAVIREGEVVVVETSSFNGENTYSSRILRIDK